MVISCEFKEDCVLSITGIFMGEREGLLFCCLDDDDDVITTNNNKYMMIADFILYLLKFEYL